MLDLTRRRALALSLPLLALALVLPATAEESQPSSPTSVSRLDEKEGVSILVLNGTPKEQGRAQGKLLAQQIVQASGALEKLRNLRRKDLAAHRAFLAKFVWEADASAEIDGIVEGVLEKLGADVKVPGTDRVFARGEVEGINTICDLAPFACSSFTITGERVEGGVTLTARNLDYPILDDAMLDSRLIVVRPARDGRHGWATVSWPGLVGCYTGMNDEGITASIHDVDAGRDEADGKKGLTPRSLGLRALVEKTGKGEGWEKRAADVLRACPVIYGNNVHVSAPSAKPPAAILEWDPDRSKEGGVTIRTSEDGEALVCTNHWRSRRKPEECYRYARLVKLMGEKKDRFTPESALEALRVSGVRGKLDLTVHSVVFCPERRTVLAAFAKDATRAAAFEKGVEIKLGELFDASKPKATAAKKWW